LIKGAVDIQTPSTGSGKKSAIKVQNQRGSAERYNDEDTDDSLDVEAMKQKIRRYKAKMREKE
jgi:hypothetical protein